MEEIISLAHNVKSVEQYDCISDSLFKNESDMQYLFVWEFFTLHILRKNILHSQIKQSYRNVWWKLFMTLSLKAKLKLVYWRIFRNVFQQEWVNISANIK